MRVEPPLLSSRIGQRNQRKKESKVGRDTNSPYRYYGHLH